MFASGGPDDRSEEDEEWIAPPWFGPPESELPACLPLGVVLARSDMGVIALSHVLVHSTGLAFELLARARDLGDRDAQRLFHEQHLAPDQEDPSPGFLRFGIELPGGARVSNLGRWPRGFDPKEQPEGPLLHQHGGGGGSSSRRHVHMRPGYWLWPLPEPGILRVTCEWPIAAIETTTVEIDASALGDLRERVVDLWTS
jgi:hypothetical protein